MSYDNWKTADDTPEDERDEDGSEELYEQLRLATRTIIRLRDDRDALLEAAKDALAWTSPTGYVQNKLRAAIAAAEEPSP